MNGFVTRDGLLCSNAEVVRARGTREPFYVAVEIALGHLCGKDVSKRSVIEGVALSGRKERNPRTNLRSHDRRARAELGRFERFRIQTPQEGVLAVLERIVQVFEHDDLFIRPVRPQVDALERDRDRRVDGATAEDELNAALIEKSLHPHERLGRGKIDACRPFIDRQPGSEFETRNTSAKQKERLTASHRKVEDEESDRIFRPARGFENLPDGRLAARDRAKKEEPLEFDDSNLFADFFEKRGLLRVPPNGRARDRAGEDRTDRASLGRHDDERDTREDEARGETQDKVPHSHDDDDRPNREVLEPRDSSVSVPKSLRRGKSCSVCEHSSRFEAGIADLFDEIDSENEDESCHDADWEEANDPGTRDEDSETAHSEQSARYPRCASDFVEQDRIDLSRTENGQSPITKRRFASRTHVA